MTAIVVLVRDPGSAGFAIFAVSGLQAVQRPLNLSPAGGVLLVLKAIGLALFRMYCFGWAANRRR